MKAKLFLTVLFVAAICANAPLMAQTRLGAKIQVSAKYLDPDPNDTVYVTVYWPLEPYWTDSASYKLPATFYPPGSWTASFEFNESFIGKSGHQYTLHKHVGFDLPPDSASTYYEIQDRWFFWRGGSFRHVKRIAYYKGGNFNIASDDTYYDVLIGEDLQLHWVVNPGVDSSSTVAIQLTRDSGSIWTTIDVVDYDHDSGSYTWTVTPPPSEQCQFRLIACDTAANKDTATSNFFAISYDTDGDSVGDPYDNCLYAYNPLQEDSDANGVGDSCDFNCANPTAWDRALDLGGHEGAYSVNLTCETGYIVAGRGSEGVAGAIYFLRTNPRGNIMWTSMYDPGLWEVALSVQQTSDSGFVLAGFTEPWGGGPIYMYLMKTDAAGDTMWTKTYQQLGVGMAWAVQQTSDGGYVLAGHVYVNDYEFCLVKTDGLGEILWSGTYGGPYQDWAYSIDQTSDGGYIIAGGSDIDQSPGMYVVKTNSVGDTLWTKTYGGSGSDVAYSIQQTTDGGYVIAGVSDGDFYVVKTNASGDSVWTKTYGGPNHEEAHSIQQTSDLGFIIAGYTGIEWDRDCYVVRTDPYGDTLWTKTFGSDDDYHGANCVRLTTDGGYVVAGYVDSLGYHSNYDFYVVKIEPDSLIHCCNHDGKRGDVNYDSKLNVSDMTYLVNYLFKGGPPPPCPEEADVDGDGNINVEDLTYLVNYLFKGGPLPAACP